MIIVMKAYMTPESSEVASVLSQARRFPGVRTEVRSIEAETGTLTEIYLIGTTVNIPTDAFEALPGVEKAVHVREKYASIGRHQGQVEAFGFEYNGVRFGQDTFHLFPGLCAVDSRKSVETMFCALKEVGVVTTRAGAYKPRTSPYDFQGHGKECLPYVFELAGKYGIRVVSVEVMTPTHMEEIFAALEATGKPTGVMLQIGTRNAQNFELLKEVGSQNELPVLFKRGMGITLDDSLNAAEYIASGGNSKIIFCLRGMKTHLGDPHRNFVDFGHVPVLKRLTRMPVCVDPSHSVGKRDQAPDGLLDIHHATAQGIVAGANMVLVDFHPNPAEALCDGPQALRLEELPHFVADCRITRQAYLARLRAAVELLPRQHRP
jgi:3-deoxy-7-phosphoheptulonate synthase